MPTREECERARLFLKQLETVADLMEKSLPEDLIEAGDLTGKIYETVGYMGVKIKDKCRR